MLHADFKQLASGFAKDKGEWVEMESAMGAAEHVAKGSHQTVYTSRYCIGSHPGAQMEYEAILVDREAHMQWRQEHSLHQVDQSTLIFYFT